jgi:hypothetical protein
MCVRFGDPILCAAHPSPTRPPFPQVAAPAPEPGRQIKDAVIRRQPQPLRESSGRDHLIVPADALGADEIAGLQVGNSCGVERDHAGCVLRKFSP